MYNKKIQLIASLRVISKLKKKHNVVLAEIEECFYNRDAEVLEDLRSNHMTNPPTLWFIAKTNSERLLKVVYIQRKEFVYEVKTAYAPNYQEKTIYRKFASRI